jgi:hypothetical protein
MRTEANGQFNNVLLTGTIILANANINGILDYGLKALVGGAIWLCYKITADYIDRRQKGKEK